MFGRLHRGLFFPPFVVVVHTYGAFVKRVVLETKQHHTCVNSDNLLLVPRHAAENPLLSSYIHIIEHVSS